MFTAELSPALCLNINTGWRLMKITRREFLILTAGFVAGCKATGGNDVHIANDLRIINAGDAANYTTDGIYRNFRDKGFFIVRDGAKLFTVSSYCTHQRCKLTAKPDRTFYCPCHGSTFDPAGHVTHGPAKRDLPTLPISSNDQNQLLVNVSGV
jgi:Rieske Fe-S protein